MCAARRKALLLSSVRIPATLCPAMRRLPHLVLCWAVSLSFVLMPYSTLHAHVADHEHTHVHGGHVHDFDSDHDAKPVDQVVKISVAATTPSLATWHWTD